MKIFSITFLLILITITQSYAQRHISIFNDHIEDIAKQQGISFNEAAQKVRNLGYNGVDVWVTLSDEKQHTLDSLGFQHASAIAYIDFIQGNKQKDCRKALDFMHKHNYTRLLLVPGLLPDNVQKHLVDSVYTRIDAFVRQAQREGIDIMIEDYDNPRSPCYDTPALNRLFTRVPHLNHVFDTGNYLFCGEEVMTALQHFRKRIHHVHLKDRKAKHNNESPAIGTGIVPLKAVVAELLKSGYDGWFTIEHFGAKDMLAYATIAINNLNAAWDEFEKNYPSPMKMKPEMTEQWTPQPIIVTPGNAQSQSAPSDAIVLFDGTNLNEWITEQGNTAEWDIHDGIMTVNKQKGDILTRRIFSSFQMHIEWRIPPQITGEGQARGNSGVMLADRYEIQILDSYQNETYTNGQCASIYKQSAPLVNAMRKPGEWNSYDIIYIAPVFNTDGNYLYHPRVTLFHNGILVQNNIEIQGTTEWIGLPQIVKHGADRIRLQAHKDPSAPISFRNIWIREL